MAVQKFAIKEWKGEKPQPAGGKVRAENPFDDIVAQSFKEGKSYGVTVPHKAGEDRDEEFKSVVRMLRNAASFHKLSLNIRLLPPETVWFEAVAKRERPRKADGTPATPLPNETKQTEEESAA